MRCAKRVAPYSRECCSVLHCFLGAGLVLCVGNAIARLSLAVGHGRPSGPELHGMAWNIAGLLRTAARETMESRRIRTSRSSRPGRLQTSPHKLTPCITPQTYIEHG